MKKQETKLQQTFRRPSPPSSASTKRILPKNTRNGFDGALIDQENYRIALRFSRPGSQFIAYEKLMGGREVIFSIVSIHGEDMTINFWDKRGKMVMTEWYYRGYLKSLRIKSLTACLSRGSRRGLRVAPVPFAEAEMTQYIPITCPLGQEKREGEMPTAAEIIPEFTQVMALWEDFEEELPLPSLEEEALEEDALPLPIISIYDYMSLGRPDEDGGYLELPTDLDEPEQTRKAMG